MVAQQAQELQSLWLQTRALGGALGLEIRRDLYRTGNLRVKRVIDGVLAWPATLLVAPLIGLLALLIKRIDPGPAFYAQTRVGRMGKPIRVLKLRSMYVDAEQRLTDASGGRSAGPQRMGALLQAQARPAHPAGDRLLHSAQQPRRSCRSSGTSCGAT